MRLTSSLTGTLLAPLRLSAWVITLVAAAACVVAPARADILYVPLTTVPAAGNATNPIEVGSRFSVTLRAQATEIGAWVNGYTTAGLTNTAFTGALYDSSLSLIEQVAIPSGTPVDSSGFAYADFLSPHVLLAGDQYVVTAWTELEPPTGPNFYTWWEESNSSALTVNNGAYVNTQYELNATGDPSSTVNTTYDFGANLQFELLPEPASLSLAVIGGLMLLRRNRGRFA